MNRAFLLVNMVDVAQLVRALVCGTKGREFDSRHSPKNGEVLERSIRLVLKTSERESAPWVRIPLSPPLKVKVVIIASIDVSIKLTLFSYLNKNADLEFCL